MSARASVSPNRREWVASRAGSHTAVTLTTTTAAPRRLSPSGEITQPLGPAAPTPAGPAVPEPVEPSEPLAPPEPATPADPTPEPQVPVPEGPDVPDVPTEARRAAGLMRSPAAPQARRGAANARSALPAR